LKVRHWLVTVGLGKNWVERAPAMRPENQKKKTVARRQRLKGRGRTRLRRRALGRKGKLMVRQVISPQTHIVITGKKTKEKR